MMINFLNNKKLLLITSVLSMSRQMKKLVQFVFDLISLFVSYYLSIWLVLNEEITKIELLLGLMFVIITVVIFKVLKIYRVIVRFSDLKFFQLIILSHLISVCSLVIVSELFDYQK